MTTSSSAPKPAATPAPAQKPASSPAAPPTPSPKRDPEQSRERILKAATTHFAARGYHGARVDEIAAAARINKRMIYHYFGNKKDLYVAVLRDNYRRIAAMEQGISSKNLSPLAKTRAYIRRYFYFLAENQEFVRLLQWESLQAHRISHRILPEIAQTTLPKLTDILEKGVRDGVFRRDLDIRHLIISINALCLLYFSRQHAYRPFWERDLVAPEILEERLRHILDFTLHGVLEDDCHAR